MRKGNEQSLHTPTPQPKISAYHYILQERSIKEEEWDGGEGEATLEGDVLRSSVNEEN